LLRGWPSCYVNAVTLRNWSRQNLYRNAQLALRCKNWFSASAAAKTGHAEIATMMAKSSASITNSQFFSLAK
jgi:hypothetical protein